MAKFQKTSFKTRVNKRGKTRATAHSFEVKTPTHDFDGAQRLQDRIDKRKNRTARNKQWHKTQRTLARFKSAKDAAKYASKYNGSTQEVLDFYKSQAAGGGSDIDSNVGVENTNNLALQESTSPQSNKTTADTISQLTGLVFD